MAREQDPIRIEALKPNPDWVNIAKLFVEQKGAEDSLAEAVEEILACPNELVVGVLPHRLGVFALGAMIPDSQKPFSITVAKDGSVNGLKIEPATKKVGSHQEYVMTAEREISFGFRPTDLDNYMGVGIQHSVGVDSILVPITKPVVGTDKVNAFLDELCHEQGFNSNKDRLVGMISHIARLALDFDAPTPNAPKALNSEVYKALSYYESLINVAEIREKILGVLALLKVKLSELSQKPHPPIHYAKPITVPDRDQVDKIPGILLGTQSPQYDDRDITGAKKILEALVSLLEPHSSDGKGRRLGWGTSARTRKNSWFLKD